MHDYQSLQHFIESYGIEHFDAREIARRALPPELSWSRIIPTLQVAERLRANWQVGYIIVASGYRDPEHNRQVGGAPGSLHLAFNALDIIPMRSATEPVKVSTVAEILSRDPIFPFMGIGLYGTFIHIDTRGLFNSNAAGARF